MEELLRNPWIQGGLGPLLAAIAAALVFYPLRVSGLAAAFGFFAALSFGRFANLSTSRPSTIVSNSSTVTETTTIDEHITDSSVHTYLTLGIRAAFDL